MPRTKRKLKNRAKNHVRHVKKATKRRTFAAGGNRCANTRRARKLRKLAAK